MYRFLFCSVATLSIDPSVFFTIDAAAARCSFAFVTASYDISADNQVAAGVYFRGRSGLRFRNYNNTWNAMEMTVNGKFHRTTWMSEAGRSELMELLTKDYNSKVGIPA